MQVHQKFMILKNLSLFHDGGCYHIETSPLICSANQWTGFYMITASIMKELSLVTTFAKGLIYLVHTQNFPKN